MIDKEDDIRYSLYLSPLKSSLNQSSIGSILHDEQNTYFSEIWGGLHSTLSSFQSFKNLNVNKKSKDQFNTFQKQFQQFLKIRDIKKNMVDISDLNIIKSDKLLILCFSSKFADDLKQRLFEFGFKAKLENKNHFSLGYETDLEKLGAQDKLYTTTQIKQKDQKKKEEKEYHITEELKNYIENIQWTITIVKQEGYEYPVKWVKQEKIQQNNQIQRVTRKITKEKALQRKNKEK